MEAKRQASKGTTLLVKKIIVLVLMFGVGYLPPFGLITPVGMQLLGVFLGALFGWVTIDLIWPSIIGVVAFGMTAFYGSMAECFSACYGNQTALLILGSLFACALITESGLGSVIISTLLNLKISKKNPYIMSFMFFIGAWIIATLTHAIVAGVLVINLYRVMAEKCKVPNQHITNSYFLVGAALGATFGDLTFPFKAMSYAILNVYTSFTGNEIPLVPYMCTISVALPVILAIHVLMGRFLWKVDMSFFSGADAVEKVTATKRQKTALGLLLVMMVGLMLPSFTSGSTFPLFVLINRMGLGGVTLFIIALMMLWPVDGEPLMSIPALSQHFQWGVYFCVCFLIPLANAFSSADAGICDTISTFLTPILSGFPPYVFMVLIVLLSVVATNFLNNLVVATLFIAILFSMTDLIGSLNSASMVLGLALASYAACATPAANPVNAFLFGQKDLVAFKTEMKVGGASCLMIAVFVLVVFYPLASLIL